LVRAGTPQTLEDLAGHECIQFELPSSGRRPPWSFRRDGRLVELETQGALTCLGDFLATTTLVRHGGGLMQAYRFTVQEALDSGELVEVLAEHGGTSRPFMLVYPQARHMPLKVRVFIDFLVSEVARPLG
jgi:DNA-binding transcriptional LysR family regulator